jgi:hypothetical protein
MESTPRFVRPVPSPTRRRSGLRAARWSKHPLMFDVSARNCWHALLACHVSRDSECSLAARQAAEDCGHVLEASPLRSIAGIGHGGFVRHDNRGRAGQSGRSIGRGIACSTSWWTDRRAFIGGTASGGSARVIRLNYSAGSSVFICRGLGLHGATGVRQVRTCHRSLRQPVHSVGSVSATAR